MAEGLLHLNDAALPRHVAVSHTAMHRDCDTHVVIPRLAATRTAHFRPSPGPVMLVR